MAYRMLEVTLQSARNLKNVNLMSRLEVYAVATISGDPMTRQCTPPDPYGGRHPTWNTTLRFTVPPTAAAGASGCLHVLLRTERSLGDRDVGEVVVPLTDILGLGGSFRDPRDLGPRPPQFAVYHVRRVHRPADTYGVLYLSYRLGGVVLPHQQPHPHAPHPHHDHMPSAAAAHEEHHVVAYPVARPSFHHHQPYAYMPGPALMPPPHSAQASSGSGGHMSSSPPSPRAYGGGGHMALAPPLSKAYGYGHLSMPPLQASGHTATQLQASGHTATPPAPQKAAAGYNVNAGALPWTTARSNGSADFGMGLSAGDMMSDAAAYNAGYRAGMAREWSGARGAVY
ncbi:protein SRC2 homolog [Aegilops tauschii subsp. strangulata]|uniref:C2 domain-containing protein n=1 Tax=Aegilops tauschii subsp. strangulata TaxID=200361 RepID=A0A453AQY7_AEGTS|nr:protein SRC2 [Aegilops tauschii subsp. strangulata]